MAFCTNCGNELDENAVVCSACGVPRDKVTQKILRLTKGNFYRD